MAEYRVPTQAELNRLLYMQGLQGKSNQQIIDENLARGTTIQSLPENFFQTASAGARRVGEFVNQAGNVQQIVNKLFPSNIGNSQYQVPIPTNFNFAPKQAPTGEVLPAGLQTQSVPVASILQAIKPADVLGISGAERAYGDIGAGKAPQPLDVVDTLGVGAVGLGATSGLLKATKGLPVGLGIQEAKGLLQTAPKSDIGFYSAVEQAAMATPRKSGAGQAFLNDIIKGQDVRADEIKWMGLDDYLKGKQNVTKQEVQDYIANNRVNVQEVRSTIPRLPGEEMAGDQGAFLPKFSQYQLPGGENYRELVLTMPTKFNNQINTIEQQIRTQEEVIKQALRYGEQNPDELANMQVKRKIAEEKINNLQNSLNQIGKKTPEYKSSHFDQPNILAHLRVNDRIDADGKKMLLIEEVQSDWHQAGREHGYASNKKQSETDELYRTLGGTKKTPVPDAPFKDTWYQLALKRAIQHAAENGYDRIGLTTGKQQAARFDLSKQVDRIDVESVADVPNLQFVDIDVVGGQKIALEVENGFVRDGEFAGKRLSEVVGKEMADKISKIAQGETRSLAGNDLSIGGEGMKKYYDEIYPKFLDKYGKKWGAKIKEVSLGGESMGRGDIENRLDHLPNGFKTTDGKFWEDYDDAMTHESSLIGSPIVRYLEITPEMKAGVSKGQPLFAAVPAIPAAGLLAPQEQQRR